MPRLNSFIQVLGRCVGFHVFRKEEVRKERISSWIVRERWVLMALKNWTAWIRENRSAWIWGWSQPVFSLWRTWQTMLWHFIVLRNALEVSATSWRQTQFYPTSRCSFQIYFSTGLEKAHFHSLDITNIKRRPPSIDVRQLFLFT